VDEDLPNGGFSTELLERALQFDGQPANYEIDVIRDWSAHLSPLMENGNYDLGYPWFRPDCSQYDLLGEASQWRCDNLIFSRPLHEIVVTFFGRAGEVDDIREPAQAQGMTICRPQGYFTHDLEAMGLTEATITRAAPSTPEDCFEMLAANEVDLVTVNADTSDRIIRDMQMAGRVSEVIDLSTIQTLHVVGMRGNPDTRLLMRRVDQGLRDIQDAGWFPEIAATHLSQ
jgi:polar amino acid transport system substrate-binding protein